MKIASFNINNINKRLPNLILWLKQSKPDVACLQQLKCETADFPEQALLKVGYSSVWEGQKSWNGVAILSKNGSQSSPGGGCRVIPPTAKPDTSKLPSTAS